MAFLLTVLPSKAFPNEVDEVKITSEQEAVVELRYNSKTIFKSTLYPIDGTIELQDIASLLEDYLDGGVYRYSIYIDGSEKGYTNIIPCKVSLDCKAQDWNGTSFLTRATSKYTHKGATEFLYCYTTYSPSFVVTALARIEGTIRRVVFRKVISSTGIVGLNVSYSAIFKNVNYDVIQYTVECGRAKMTYRLIPDGMADNLHEYGFINSFYQRDYITLMGHAEKEVKIERLHAIVGGQYRNFQVEAVPHWTINSGKMLDGMSGLFEDFISADRVWRMEDNCEMAVTDSDFKPSDANDATCEGSVTLRETGRRYRHRLPKVVNTFDLTFDETFK